MRTPAKGLDISVRSGVALGLGHGLDDLELATPLGQYLRRELGQVVVVELPRGVLAPPKRRLHGGPRRRRGLEHPQREVERLRLRLGVERASGRVAEGEVAEQ